MAGSVSGSSPNLDGELRPSWLVEPCPPWCVGGHREADHVEDRYHRDTASLIRLVVDADPVPGAPRWSDIEVVVRAGRHVGERTEWLVIEAADQPRPRLLLTLASARLLEAQIREQLGAHDLV